MTLNIKKIAGYVLSARQRVRHVPMKANRCTTNHRTKYTACEQGVVYRIPLSGCRCINDRVREHAATLKNVPLGHLAMHHRDACCDCQVDFYDIITMHKNRDRPVREITEAMEIEENVNACAAQRWLHSQR